MAMRWDAVAMGDAMPMRWDEVGCGGTIAGCGWVGCRWVGMWVGMGADGVGCEWIRGRVRWAWGLVLEKDRMGDGCMGVWRCMEVGGGGGGNVLEL